MMILFFCIFLLLMCVYIFEPHIDETKDGDLIMWYTPFGKNKNRKYFVLIRHKDLLN